jgi:hypothetical protein
VRDLETVGAIGEREHGSGTRVAGTERVTDPAGEIVDLSRGLHGRSRGVPDFDPELGHRRLGGEAGDSAGKKDSEGEAPGELRHTCMFAERVVCSGYFGKSLNSRPCSGTYR